MNLLWIYILTPYITINTILAILIYRKYKIYVNPKIIRNSNNEEYNLHDKYPEFKRYDNVSFIRIIFGLNFLVVWRVILSIILILFYGFKLK